MTTTKLTPTGPAIKPRKSPAVALKRLVLLCRRKIGFWLLRPWFHEVWKIVDDFGPDAPAQKDCLILVAGFGHKWPWDYTKAAEQRRAKADVQNVNGQTRPCDERTSK